VPTRVPLQPGASGAPDKFADYIKFDDLFGASAVFTSGTARQRKKETDVYVKVGQ
jgi:hypothetical protein